jgi:hypothetical protein
MSPSTMLQLLPTYRSQAGCDHGFGVAIGYGFSSTANDGRLGIEGRYTLALLPDRRCGSSGDELWAVMRRVGFCPRS